MHNRALAAAELGFAPFVSRLPVHANASALARAQSRRTARQIPLVRDDSAGVALTGSRPEARFQRIVHLDWAQSLGGARVRTQLHMRPGLRCRPVASCDEGQLLCFDAEQRRNRAQVLGASVVQAVGLLSASASSVLSIDAYSALDFAASLSAR